MASAFGHAIAAVAIGTGFSDKIKNWKFWCLGIFCAVIPDADVVSFWFGIPYESFWGHRGFSHSFLFSILLGIAVTFIFYRASFLSKNGFWLSLFFIFCTASHSLLDAMTTGGLGVAFFSPFENSRYFLPWRPILVSPIGVDRFMSGRGLAVLQSELIWIGIPSLIFVMVSWLVKRIVSNRNTLN